MKDDALKWICEQAADLYTNTYKCSNNLLLERKNKRMNWIKCTDRLPDTSRRVEVASMVEPEEQGTEEYRHYQDSNTVIDGYYQDGAWCHVTGNPIDRIFGFEPKMWRDKNVCD